MDITRKNRDRQGGHKPSILCYGIIGGSTPAMRKEVKRLSRRLVRRQAREAERQALKVWEDSLQDFSYSVFEEMEQAAWLDSIYDDWKDDLYPEDDRFQDDYDRNFGFADDDWDSAYDVRRNEALYDDWIYPLSSVCDYLDRTVTQQCVGRTLREVLYSAHILLAKPIPRW